MSFFTVLITIVASTINPIIPIINKIIIHKKNKLLPSNINMLNIVMYKNANILKISKNSALIILNKCLV